MRSFLTAVVFGLYAIACQAEASFEQIEGLIQQKNYAAAASGLEGIIQNHPKSAKAFYAMAQAQAGLGNLEKANKALTIATGLNPSLDFAPEGSVRKLKEAITPQTAKIEQIEETHFWRNFSIAFVLFAGGGLALALYLQKKREEEEAELSAKLAAQAEAEARAEAKVKRMMAEREAEEAAERTKNAKVQPIKGAEAKPATEPKTDNTPKYTASPAYSNPVPQPTYTPQPTHTTVVNNTSSGSDLLTGVIIGNMMSGHSNHHETTKVVEREVIREVPAPSRSTRDSSWDDTPSTSSSRSSSWDSDSSSSSSRSSSWDSGSSSSSSSSSWDSGSSSSSSSSSWDSGSSSSSSDSGSSSSWD